jgi:hypothetical protein
MDRSLGGFVLVPGLVLGVSACAGPAEEARPEAPEAPQSETPDPDWRTAATPDGRTTCSFRVVGGGDPPRNEDFELEVVLERDGERLRGAELVVSGFMPEHGHGMVRWPRTTPREDGSFLVEGMLLHMRGHWQLFFDIHEATGSSRACFDLEI